MLRAGQVLGAGVVQHAGPLLEAVLRPRTQGRCLVAVGEGGRP